MKNKPPRIYRDFQDYWQHGNHGFSSCSIEYAKDTWKDFEPTINANRDEYVNAILDTYEKDRKIAIEQMVMVMDYLREFKLEEVAGVKFYRWWMDRARKVSK